MPIEAVRGVDKLPRYIASTQIQVNAMFAQSKAYSAQEYLALAANQALEALKEGNYGIGAVYIYRHEGTEYVIAGRNGLISRQDTHLHAEQDAIDMIEKLGRGEKIDENRIVLVRPAPHQKTERLLATSLEPCPMCTARILTHKLHTVYIGATDPIAGSMLEGREEGLPYIWKTMRRNQNVQVIVPDTSDPQSANYVSEAYRDLTAEIFLSTRELIDQQMEQQGLAALNNFRLSKTAA